MTGMIMNRELKAEWWELWWVGKLRVPTSKVPVVRPVFIRAYGAPEEVPWVPDGCFPTKEEALAAKRRRGSKYDRVIHVKRYLCTKKCGWCKGKHFINDSCCTHCKGTGEERR